MTEPNEETKDETQTPPTTEQGDGGGNDAPPAEPEPEKEPA